MKKPLPPCQEKEAAPNIQITSGYSNPVAANYQFLTREQQRKIILRALRTGPKTTNDLRMLGCWQAPTRIFEIRQEGISVETTLVNAWGADGRMHPRVALYTLHEPEDHHQKGA